MTKSHKHKKESLSKNNESKQNDRNGDEKIKAAEVKNAHASGIGSLGRSEENKIEKLNSDELENNKEVY